MSFLKAEWRKLIMANYAITPDLLKPYLPNGVEIDFHDGKCYVSLVAFMFLNTKLLGVKVPFYINFEEVNLRFYVKRKVGNEYKRGVVFIKEIVPKPALTFVANTVYKENYQTLPMKHFWEEIDENLKISYQWKTDNGWNSMEVIANTQQKEISKNSEIEFIAEHYWGYAKVNDKKTTEYEVKHPIWKYYPILNSRIDVDFCANYGEALGYLSNEKPISVFLLEGSEVSVENKIVF